MTDNKALIEEARQTVSNFVSFPDEPGHLETLINRLADALEAAQVEKERMSTVASGGYRPARVLRRSSKRMNILGLVPARSGSKRLPGKNMSILQDETLVARALRIASEASVFAQIACSTDSEVIAQHIRELGFKAIMRPPEMATDTSRDVEWVNHAVVELAWEGGAFCILRPTNPFRSAETIRRAVKQFKEQADHIDSLRAVQPVSERPEKMWRPFTTWVDTGQDSLQKVQRGLEPCLARLYKPAVEECWHERQSSSFEPLYIQNGCIEIAHTRVLPNSVSGNRIAPFFTEGREGFDINEPRDLEYASRVSQEWLYNG